MLSKAAGMGCILVMHLGLCCSPSAYKDALLDDSEVVFCVFGTLLQCMAGLYFPRVFFLARVLIQAGLHLVCF